jgi:hypothetical protein
MTRHVWTVTIVTIAGLIAMSFGCGGKGQLTRGKAKDLIERSEGFKPTQTLRNDGTRANKGVELGFWVHDPWSSEGFKLTAKGSSYFGGVNRAEVSMLKPVSRRFVEITGMTAAPGFSPDVAQSVTFTWKWDFDGYPPEVSDLIQGPTPTPNNGEAVLKLYDDGWRVENVSAD